MAGRNGTLAVQPDSEEKIAPQPKGVMVRPKKKEEITTTTPALQAQAVAIAELELSFDPDLRLAMIQRLVQARSEIEILTTHEQKLAKVIEIGRLTATEKARKDGVQQARAEFAIRAKKYKKEQQYLFMKNELPKLIASCDFLPIDELKSTVEAFAARLDIQLKWEESDEGLQCFIA
jgi:flagellar biosynthesis/type III secretory pathway protein FliH